MLILCRFSILGLQLLLVTHIARAFVLLTANVDDVKKLARKFVSDSLAEKIAEFITNATKNMGTNISEENDLKSPGGSHQVSEENNRYNVEKHGFESAANEIVKSPEEEKVEESLPDSSASKERKELSELENKIKIKEKPVKKPEYSVRLEGPSRYVKVKPKTVKQYAYPLEREKKPNPKMSEEDEKYNQKTAAKYLIDNAVKVTPGQSKSLYAERYAADNKPDRKKVKGRPYRLLSHLNSIEDNEVTDVAKDSNSSAAVDDFSENELFLQKTSMEQLTTKKAAFEFDQYDNKKYNKNTDFVATSGSVILRRIPEDQTAADKWWEKDLPNDGEKKGKSWH